MRKCARLIVVLMLLFTASCATRMQTKEGIAIDTYARLVHSFNIIGDTLKTMCIDGVIDSTTCNNEIKPLHDKVADALDDAGYYLELMIQLDPVQIALCKPVIKVCKPDDAECNDENVKACAQLLKSAYEQKISIAETGLQQLRSYYVRYKMQK